MNFKRFHESKNLFDGTKIEAGRINETTGAVEYATGTTLLSFDNETVTISTSVAWRGFVSGFIDAEEYLQKSYVSDATMYGYEYAYDENKEFLGTVSQSSIPANTKYIRVSFQMETAVTNAKIKNIMFNTGSQPLPYEPYSSEVWHDIPCRRYGTSTDTITTLPADLYADGNNATVGISGNMEQSGTPSPATPIQPQECGDLETVGEKAGQYKIPISSANTTTNVYLGEVETTRKVKKLVLDGTESWVNAGGNAPYRLLINDIVISSSTSSIEWYCSHYQSLSIGDSWASYDYCISRTSTTARSLQFRDVTKGDFTAFKQYLAAQYAAGTPVTVWYVLATPTTGIVNEPLRKIEEYADTVSGITIPTTAGKDTFDVQTTLKPSEVTANYHGWHTGAVHECENGAWT